MIGLSKNWNGTQNNNEEAGREEFPPISNGNEPAEDSWAYSSSTRLVEAEIFRRSAIAPRKKRARRHADYRELLALELEARKLHLCSPPTGARPMLHMAAQAAERAPGSKENSNGTQLPLSQSNFETAAFWDAHRPVLLVVDQRMNMHFGSGRDLKSVIAVKAAALIAWRMLASQKAVGAIVFNDKRTSQLGVGCNRLHTLLTLQALVNQNHDLSPDAGICSNPRMLNDALRSVNKLAADPFIFLITDASGKDEETFRLATNISLNSNLVVLLIYDPAQMKGLGFARQRRAKRCFFPEGVPVVTINTRSDLLRQLRRSLSNSAMRAFAAIRSRQASRSSIAPTP